LIQRKTQTSTYWQSQFVVSADDAEYLYNLILESNQPQPTGSLALALVQRRCQAEEVSIRTEFQRGSLYQPQGSYQNGEVVVFPRFDYVTGTVKGQRQGSNPQYGDFTVIEVEFEGNGGVKEFASNFEHPHSLNLGKGQSLAEAEGLASPQELYDLYKDNINLRLTEALEANDEFVSFRDRWFLKGLLAPIHAGHLNIAEAAIDIKEGPLPAEALLKEIELPADISAKIQEVSLNVALSRDERFDNVGPKGQVLWYLRRLEPPEATSKPRRLYAIDLPYDIEYLDGELRRLVNEIDDEATDPALIRPAISDAETVMVTLNYPHRRAGTLPITPKTAPFFPEADDHHVRITFIDKQSGERMPGWVVSQDGYVFGLDRWYAQNQLPTGAYISLYRTDDPLTILVDYRPVRLKREWVRVAVPQDGRLGFQLLKQPITCEYDALMIIGEADPAGIDVISNNAEEHDRSILSILRFIFPELAKLNPQGTVHAKTLYSALNVVRRCPPGPIFDELSAHACFIPMGHGYWTFDPSLED
jgi:hypothetical protein